MKDIARKLSDDKFLEGEGKVKRAAGKEVGDKQERRDIHKGRV